MKVSPMRRKDASKLLEQLGSEYGCDPKYMLDKYVFFISDKNKVYIVNDKMKEIPLDNLRVNSFGLYFCENNKGYIRLSMEGSQIIGNIATKNIHSTNQSTSRKWLLGEDIDCDKEYGAFVILKNLETSDFIGSGKYKEQKILNYVPKQRRIRE